MKTVRSATIDNKIAAVIQRDLGTSDHASNIPGIARAATANIGFFATRLMLLLGQFNYGKKGILDVTHTRLFTFRSIRELLKQSGYKILEMRGIPAPFPVALGNSFIARVLIRINSALVEVSKGLFSYQIFVRAEAMPTVNNLLHETISGSSALKAEVLAERLDPASGRLQDVQRPHEIVRD
jgi:hypothetical protein